jgi:hypothetical protein
LQIQPLPPQSRNYLHRKLGETFSRTRRKAIILGDRALTKINFIKA